MSPNFDYDVLLYPSSKDQPAVRELAQRLQQDGLKVWVEDWVIQPGDSIQRAIKQRLARSRTLILCLSENAFDLEWNIVEHHTRIFRDPQNQNRRFIPLRLDDTPIPDPLSQYLVLDWQETSPEQYSRLLAVCKMAQLENRDHSASSLPPIQSPPRGNLPPPSIHFSRPYRLDQGCGPQCRWQACPVGFL